MKRVIATVCLLCCTLFLMGFTSTGRYSGVDMEVMEDYDTGYNTWSTLRLDGKYISLPCSAKLFIDLGYRAPTDVPNVSPNYKMSMVSFINGNGEELNLSVINLKNKPLSVSECYVYDVAWYSGYTGDIDVCGVGNGSTVSEVTQAIGEAVHKGDALNGAVMRLYESVKEERDMAITYDANDIAIEFLINTEEPEIAGYQSQWENESSSQTRTRVDVREDRWYDEDENVINIFESKSAGSYVLVILAFMALIIVVVVTVIVLVMRRSRDTYEIDAFARAEELKETRRILNTDIEKLADEVNDDGE